MQAIPNDALNTIVDPSRKRKVESYDEVSVMTKKKKEELRILKKVQKEMHEMVVIKTANQKRFEDMAEASIESESASLFTPPQTKPVVMGYDNGRSVYTVGEFVEVACDTSPGMNRESGTGFITNIASADDGIFYATVKYELDGKCRLEIPLTDLTVKDYQANFSGQERRKRKKNLKEKDTSIELDFSREGKSAVNMLISQLKEGFSRGRIKGWHRRELKLNDKFVNGCGRVPNYNNHEKSQLLYEYDKLAAFLQGSKLNKYYVTGKNEKLKKRRTIHNPYTLTYLLHAWGGNKATITRFRKEMQVSARKRGLRGVIAKCTNVIFHEEEGKESKNVIDCYDTAKRLFTPEYLFVRDKMTKDKQLVI